MAHNTEKLRELLERVEKAAHAEIDLDLDLCVAFQVVGEYVVTGENVRRPDDGDRWGSRVLFHEPVSVDDAPRLTGSLDASIALVERMLPGWDWQLSRSDLGGEFSAVVEHWDGDVHVSSRPTAPLAILAALLRALISQAEGEAQHG